MEERKTEQENLPGMDHYIGIALRRKWWIIIPLVIGVLGSFGVYKVLPKIYKATTLILVQPQSVPESYVRPTTTAFAGDYLSTLSQQILSRTRLEKVIQEFNLYPEMRGKFPMEEIVGKMRKRIEINVQSKQGGGRTQNTFSVSFEGESPEAVKLVTNKLASLFIEENLKSREIQAEGTSDFLRKELQKMEEQLKRKDEDIRRMKERYMGQLPQQLDANLRILERLQQQMRTTSENIKTAEDRSDFFQNQIDLLRAKEALRTPLDKRGRLAGPGETPEAGIPEDPVVTQLNLLKRELSNAQSKYTESHPDVVDLKRKVADLEPKAAKVLERQEARLKELRARRERNAQGNVISSDPETERMISQYVEQQHQVRLEAKRLREEIKSLKDEIQLYQRRVEETPKREQELLLLTRDYDLLKSNYQSLLDKSIQAKLAESLEMRQQGEQFKVLDPARLPEKPFRPDRNKILLVGALIGLVSGLGLTWLRESLDQSFHSETELEEYLKLPVLAILPNLREERTSSKN